MLQRILRVLLKLILEIISKYGPEKWNLFIHSFSNRNTDENIKTSREDLVSCLELDTNCDCINLLATSKVLLSGRGEG